MPNSTQYTVLEARIAQLDTHLLPPINPSVIYTFQELDSTRAYCLLCHAEMESYIEEVVLYIATLAFNKWQSNKNIVTPIIFHLAYNFKQPAGKPKEPPYSMVGLSYTALRATISNNNGIKDNNISNILKPIGYEIDPTLLIGLTSFGGTRGEIAHTSFRTQQPLDPATEKSKISQLLIGLKEFDEGLVEYEQNGTQNIAPPNMAWNKLNFWDRIKILFSITSG